jgi:hypothetical protein
MTCMPRIILTDTPGPKPTSTPSFVAAVQLHQTRHWEQCAAFWLAHWFDERWERHESTTGPFRFNGLNV